jgi:hypothetical protein
MPRECNPRDFFDTNVQVQDDLYRLAYLDAMTKDQYDRRKQSGDFGGLLGIPGVDVKLDLSYDEMREQVSQEKRLRNINYEERHQQAIFSSMLSDEGRRAYIACVNGSGGIGTTLTVRPDAQTNKEFFVQIRWDGGVGGQTGKFDFVGKSPFQVIGGKVVGEYALKPPREIKSGQEIAIQVEREDLRERFELISSVNGYQDSIALPPYDPRPITIQVRTSQTVTAHSDFGHNGNDGADDRQIGEIVAGPNEEFLYNTALLLGDAGPGVEGSFGFETKDARRIVWHCRAYTSSKEWGAWARARVNVLVASW